MNNPSLRSPILVALLHPINLAMLALVVASGLCAAWWMFPLGLVFWVVMVIAVARQPGLKISHKIESRSPLAPRFQNRFNNIERVQINLFNALAGSDARVRRALKPVQDDMAAIVDEAYQLCLRSSALENYRVVTEGKVDLDAEWVHLSQNVENATDSRVRKEYQEALESLEIRLGQRKQIIAQLDRVDAELTSKANTLDGLLTEILGLQAMGLKHVTENLPRIRKLMQNELHELHEFERQEELASEPSLPPGI
jgi:hypothetical protein